MSELQSAAKLYDETRYKTVTDVWIWVREHAYSLDSMKACKVIQSAFDASTEIIAGRCEQLATKLDEERAKNRVLRKEIKALRLLELLREEQTVGAFPVEAFPETDEQKAETDEG